MIQRKCDGSPQSPKSRFLHGGRSGSLQTQRPDREHHRPRCDLYPRGDYPQPQVVKEYTEKGVITVQSPDEVPAGATVVIRAHGIPKGMRAKLSSRGVKIVDATCPKVAAACLLIKRHTTDDRTLLLYGEEIHPEVKCLLSYAAGEAVVFDSQDDCEQLTLDPNKSTAWLPRQPRIRIFSSRLSSFSSSAGSSISRSCRRFAMRPNNVRMKRSGSPTRSTSSLSPAGTKAATRGG